MRETTEHAPLVCHLHQETIRWICHTCKRLLCRSCLVEGAGGILHCPQDWHEVAKTR